MNEKQTAAALTREKLLDAAVCVLQAQGAQHMTLSAVAAQAEVSKGGLLHHFPSKDALIEGVLRYLHGLFNATAQQFYDSDPHPTGRWSRAYAQAAFAAYDLPLHVLVPLFVYVNQSEQLRAIVSEDVAFWEARLLNDGISPERATIVRMTADSYLTERATGLNVEITPENLLAEVLKLTY